MNSQKVPCKKCIHYKTRVFYKAKDLKEEIEERILKGKISYNRAKRIYEKFDQNKKIRLYWCRKRDEGPFISQDREVICSEFEI